MVRFEKDRIIIDIETNSPVETWISIQKDLIYLLSARASDDIDPHYSALQLLDEMSLNDDIIKYLENKNKEGGLNNGTI